MATHATHATHSTYVPYVPFQPAAARAVVARSTSRRSRLRAELRQDLPWLLLSVGTALGAAAASSAWMIENVHLF